MSNKRHPLEEAVRRHVPEGASLLAALSGGADSVALLAALVALRDELRLTLAAAHLHHGLRGAAADADAAFCQTLCDGWGVPLTVEHGRVRENPSGRGEEADARTLRYAFLERCADERRCAYILTAHTADDNAETLLLNLVRGAGLDGLSGIPPVRGRLLRPLLDCTRQEVEAYLRAGGHTYCTDGTNAEDCYRRNRIRHHVLPPLRAENPSLEATLTRTCALLRQDAAYLDAQAAQAFSALRREDGGVSASALRELPPSLSGRVVRRMMAEALTQSTLDMAFAHTEAVLKLCAQSDGSAQYSLSHGLTAVRQYDTLWIQAVPFPKAGLQGEGFQPVRIVYGEAVCLPELGLVAHWQKSPQNVYNLVYSFDLDSAIIADALWMRPRKAGDRVVLQGRQGTRLLQDLFVNAKLPRPLRDSIPVVCDDTGIVAVAGFGVASRAAPKAGAQGVTLWFTKKDTV